MLKGFSCWKVQPSTFVPSPTSVCHITISQRQEALNSQPLHLTFPKLLFNQHTDSFSTVPPRNSTHYHLLLLCHVSTQPNHLPFSCAFLPSHLSYHNLSFFSCLILSLTSGSNFLLHENHQCQIAKELINMRVRQ